MNKPSILNQSGIYKITNKTIIRRRRRNIIEGRRRRPGRRTRRGRTNSRRIHIKQIEEEEDIQ